jgi:O-antigen ligase
MVRRSNRFVVLAAGVAAFAAGLTQTLGPAGQGVAGRTAIGDLALMLLIGVSFVVVVLRGGKLRFTKHYSYALPLLAAFFISAIFADNILSAVIELAVHVFAILFSLAMFNLLPLNYSTELASRITRSMLLGSGVIAVYGLVTLFVFPDLNPAEGGLAGSFRNTGQAGNYFLTFTTFGIAAILSGFIPRTFFNSALVFCLLFALILTGKRASMLGLGVGLMLLVGTLMFFSGRKSDIRIGSVFVVLSFLIGICAFVVVSFALSNVEGALWRFEAKFTKAGLDNFSDGFYFKNLLAGVHAFLDRPVLGVGLGNIVGVYDEFEIHSTYLALLATSGLVGLMAYSFFLWFVLKSTFVVKWTNGLDRFLMFFFPLLLGQVITWMYTYSIRKREFWITIFLLAVLTTIQKRLRSRENPPSSQF